MSPRTASVLVFVASVTACAGPPRAPQENAWSVQGSWTDACCCKVPCPCLFGTPPTEGYCEGASLLEVERGHFGGVSLDGVSAVVAYRVGGWTRLFVDDGATQEQVEAFGSALPYILPYVTKGRDPVVTSAPVAVSRGDGTIRFSAADTTVDLARVESKSGEPIRLENLPAKGTPFPASHGHVQYRSRTLSHASQSGSFAWSERNGFSSRLDLSGVTR